MLLSTATAVLAPKNRGLAAQAEAILNARGIAADVPSYVRGEDVGQLANAAAREGRAVLAMTGDDLLDNWLAAGNVLDDRLVRERVAWNDPRALYGKPALCLIAAPETRIDRGDLRIAICSRYAALAEPTLLGLERGGTRITRTYCQGALEAVLAAGMADAAIDIVVTGKSIEKYGYAVRVVLYRSDLAVLVSR